MDFWFGFVVGVAASFMIVMMMGGIQESSPVRILKGRISKDDTSCRDCGSQMKDAYPGSKGARRHYRCPECGYFDSYIDMDYKKNPCA
jgi:tRNA(Ile2) C34 agmatinyltransferase TiaS